MHLLFSVPLVACLLSHNVLAARPKKCESITTRKEVRDLSSSEWRTIKDTIEKMQDLGWFRFYASIHEVYFPVVHGVSQFLPFHRRFVRYFEMTAQRINPDFALPYWNEFADYRNPADSSVLSDRLLGGNGQGPNKCVMDGVQANWTMTYPNEHCLQRNYSDGDSIKPWYSAEFIQSIMQRSDTMADFRDRMENSQHGLAHLGVRGDMSTKHSANDFLFMLHHAFIDRIWSIWQDDGHRTTFDGPGSMGEEEMTLDSKILFFQDTVEDVMYLGRGQMCYEYDEPSSEPDLLSKRDNINSDLTSLPHDVLCKWYPKSCDQATSDNTTESTAPIAHIALKQLPLPAEISQEAMEMHGFDPAAVQRMADEARKFVEDMNAAGFVPKY
ncbi:hypothetical protein H4S00_006102 [Coemansia sp. D1744]|nr:hypothetical protein H4S00_006102 [Coemansia sp. D1744]